MGLIDKNNLIAFYNRIKSVFQMKINLDTTGTSISTDQAAAANTISQDIIVNKLYPVGSIFMSTSSTNPGTTMGGTWELWGAGKTPVSVDSSSIYFESSDITGGSKTKTVSHSHTVNSHTHTINAHKHTMNSHTHTIASHTHGAGTLTAAIGAVNNNAKTLAYVYTNAPSGVSTTSGVYFLNDGHTVSTSCTNWNHGTIITGTSAGSGDLTTSSVTETCGTKELTTNGSSPSTNNQSITLSTLQPYITCYMWKRTA